jgi:hypothetical protein
MAEWCRFYLPSGKRVVKGVLGFPLGRGYSVCADIPLAQMPMHDLSSGGSRHFDLGDEIHAGWAFVARQTLAAPLPQLDFVNGLTWVQHHHCLDRFPPFLVRYPNDGDILYGRVLAKYFMIERLQAERALKVA